MKINGNKKEVKIMPRLDGTGPRGMGPLTGRGMGWCGGWRAGLGRGGWGRGLGRFFGLTPSRDDLEEYRNALKEELSDIEKTLKSRKK